MGTCRLNNFILWCKNWYVSINNEDIITQAKKILQLDGYLSINNPISIALNYIDELVEKGIIPPIKMQVWNEGITENMHYYNLSYDASLLYQIKHYFMFISNDKITISPPNYSKKTYKLGFIAPKEFGNSYTMNNFKAKKYFKN